MNTQRDPFRSINDSRSKNDSRRMSGMPAERRLPLSDIIRHRLLTMAERDRQRSRLLNAIIFAQALLTAASAAGYAGAPSAALHVTIAGIAVAIYVIALAANTFFRRANLAAYLLVVGGGLAVAAQTLSFALAPGGSAAQAAQAAQLFVAIIIEAGLLFVPEATLLTAFVSTILAAFAILLALSVEPSVDRPQAYLLVVYTVGLQALAGLIAWLLAQFIFESVLEAQKAQELQFAHARLEALNAQIGEQQRQMDESISNLQVTIARAISGEPTVRADITDGALSPLAESLNLVLQRLEDAMHAEQMRERLGAAALPMMDAIARMGDAPTPTPTSLPIMTNTPFDSVQVMFSQMQAAIAQRMNRVQRLVGEIVGVMSQSEEPLENVSQAVQDAQSIAGALRSVAEQLIETAHRQLGLLNQARRTLIALLPLEVARAAGYQLEAGVLDETESDDLRGLGGDLGIGNPGLTGQFPALQPSEKSQESAGFVPLTKPLPAVHTRGETDPETSGARTQRQEAAKGEKGRPKRGEAADTGAGGAAPELMEVWDLLAKVNDEATRLERALSQLARELGVQSRSLHTADANAAWFKQAITAMRSSTTQLQQTAGAAQPVPGAPDMQPGPDSRPLGQPPLARPRFATRPLHEDPAHGQADTLATLAGDVQPPRSDDKTRDDDDAVERAPGSLRAADLLSFDDPSSPARNPFPADEPEAQNP